MLVALLLSLGQPGLPEVVRLRPPAAAEAEAEKNETPQTEEPAPEEPAKPTMPPRASFAGEWTLGLVRRGTLCRITLSNQAASQGVFIASLGDNCPPSLFAVARWRLTESALILANRAGRPLARLSQKDRGWQGPTLDRTGRAGPDAMMEKVPTR